jgi:tripartite-type tricarboxylate transporter receptor subunit TctC
MKEPMTWRISARHISRRLTVGAGAAAALDALSSPARSQAWPDHPVRIIVPAPAGGSTDIYTRVIANVLTERLGQPVVVENRPSAGGVIGSIAVARAAPDGYTLLACASSVLTIAPAIQSNIGFDPQRDFVPISLIYTSPLVLVVTRDFPPTTVRELIALAKAEPRKFNLAYPGNGTTNHVAAVWFNRAAGTDIVLVPYAGNAGVVNALLRGDTQMAIDSIPTSGPLIRGGTVRAIAVAGAHRSPAIPNVPTVAESGLPGYEVIFWNGLFAPAGTPSPIIARLNEAVDAALRTPALSEQMRAAGAEPGGGPPAALADRFAVDLVNWSRVIREAGVRNE